MRLVCINVDDVYSNGHLKIGNIYTVVEGVDNPSNLVTILVNKKPWCFNKSCFITIEENRSRIINSLIDS